MKDSRFDFAIPQEEKLLSYGFKKQGKELFCSFDLDMDFALEVTISKDGKTDIKVIEKELEEEYPLVYLETSTGDFIYQLKLKMNERLEDLLSNCYQSSTFMSKQGRMIATYIKEKYNDTLTLFDGDYCYTVKRKDSQKWYLLLMRIKKSKLGFKGDDSLIEIIDIKGDIKDIDNTYIFPGWHMNKKHWITIILDNGFPFDDLISFIDYSYQLNG